MLRIGICEDDLEELTYQGKLIEDCMREFSVQAEVVKCISGEELLLEIEEHGRFDLLFLDIEMSRLNGIAVASEIRKSEYRTLIIFVSAHDSYCKELIDVQPFAFLDKPLDKKLLTETLQKAMRMQNWESGMYQFRWNRVHYQVELREIMYFTSEKRVISVVTKKQTYQFYGMLDFVEHQLAHREEIFLRVHQSWLVNARYIKEYHYEKIVLENDEEVAVSKRNRERIRDWYVQKLKEQI